MGPKKRVAAEPETGVKRLRRGSDKVDEEYTINGRSLYWTNVNILHKKTDYEVMWPVFKTSQPPEDFTKKLKKIKDSFLLKFFNIKRYEVIDPSDAENVYTFDECRKKGGRHEKFVQEGLNQLSEIETTDLERFIKDVCFAEKVYSGLSDQKLSEFEKELKNKIKPKSKEPKKSPVARKSAYMDIFKKPEPIAPEPPPEPTSPKLTKSPSPKKPVAKPRKSSSISSSDDKFICSVCQFGCDRVNALTMHMKTHSAEEIAAATAKSSPATSVSSSPSPKKGRTPRKAKQEKSSTEETAPRKEESTIKRNEILDDWTDEKAIEDKKRLDVTSIFDRLMESKKMTESPQSSQDDNNEETKENGDSDDENRMDEDYYNDSDCGSPGDYTMRASNVSEEDREVSPARSGRSASIGDVTTESEDEAVVKKSPQRRTSSSKSTDSKEDGAVSPQRVKVSPRRRISESSSSKSTTEAPKAVVEPTENKQAIEQSSSSSTDKSDAGSTSSNQSPGKDKTTTSTENKSDSQCEEKVSESFVSTNLSGANNSEKEESGNNSAIGASAEKPGPSNTADSGKKSKPTAAVKPTIDSSMLQQALQGEIKSSPAKETEENKEDVVHLVPMEGADGTVSYMLFSYHNDQIHLQPSPYAANEIQLQEEEETKVILVDKELSASELLECVGDKNQPVTQPIQFIIQQEPGTDS